MRAPAFSQVQRIYADARRAVIGGSKNSYSSQPETEAGHAIKQSTLRRVHVEFQRRLKRAGIHVEGA